MELNVLRRNDEVFNIYYQILDYYISKMETNTCSPAELRELKQATLNVHNVLKSEREGFFSYKKKLERDVVDRFISNYEDSDDPDIVPLVSFVNKTGALNVFNYPFTEKYTGLDVEFALDEESGLYYTTMHGKKMYISRGVDISLPAFYSYMTMEQDLESPHRYFDDIVNIKEGDIVIDAGVAEGNFSLEIIDRVKKLYLVECDENWLEALEKTFAPYKDKVVIVDKYLSDKNDDSHITIDKLLDGSPANFIKMDIEGAEQDSLRGAKQTFINSPDLRCAICAYHSHNAQEEIEDILHSYGCTTYPSKGYMCLRDSYFNIHNDLRRGVIRAYK